MEPACLSGVIRISGLVRRLWIGSRSISFLAAIIAEGVPARHPAVAHMARADARPTAAVGWGPGNTGDVGAAHTSRPFGSEGSARKPQRLPRRRFLRRSPLNVTSAMEPRSPLAVRRFLPILLRDDGFTTKQTGGERIGDEAIANPGVDPLALVADSGRLRFWQRRRMLGVNVRSNRHGVRSNGVLMLMLDHRRRRCKLTLEAIIATPVVIGRRPSSARANRSAAAKAVSPSLRENRALSRRSGLATASATCASRSQGLRADERGRGRLDRAPRADCRPDSRGQDKSWYMGSNVEGKPRRLLSYIGGVGAYRQKCDAVAASGCEGFAMR